MEHLIEPMRWVHVIGGTIVLLLGLLNLILTKGGPRHRFLGRLYVWVMIVVSVTAILVSYYRITTELKINQVFLFVIGLFSLYMVVSGYRFGRIQNTSTHIFDKAWSVIGILFALVLLCLSTWMLVNNVMSIGIIAGVFGIIQSFFAYEDIRYYFLQKRRVVYGPLTWYFTHIGRMIGSYIAATTAFLVNAVDGGPELLKWLGPTFVGGILIAGFTRHYRKKFKL